MTRNEQAALISLVFLGLWTYGMYVFDDFSINTSLPLLGAISFSFRNVDKYFSLFGLLAAFVIFLEVRRVRKTEGAEQTGDQ